MHFYVMVYFVCVMISCVDDVIFGCVDDALPPAIVDGTGTRRVTSAAFEHK